MHRCSLLPVAGDGGRVALVTRRTSHRRGASSCSGTCAKRRLRCTRTACSSLASACKCVRRSAMPPRSAPRWRDSASSSSPNRHCCTRLLDLSGSRAVLRLPAVGSRRCRTRRVCGSSGRARFVDPVVEHAEAVLYGLVVGHRLAGGIEFGRRRRRREGRLGRKRRFGSRDPWFARSALRPLSRRQTPPFCFLRAILGLCSTAWRIASRVCSYRSTSRTGSRSATRQKANDDLSVRPPLERCGLQHP